MSPPAIKSPAAFSDALLDCKTAKECLGSRLLQSNNDKEMWEFLFLVTSFTSPASTTDLGNSLSFPRRDQPLIRCNQQTIKCLIEILFALLYCLISDWSVWFCEQGPPTPHPRLSELWVYLPDNRGSTVTGGVQDLLTCMMIGDVCVLDSHNNEVAAYKQCLLFREDRDTLSSLYDYFQSQSSWMF